MSKNDSLGTRMKTYEQVTKAHLMRRTPVIIRLDGKAFHTFTKRINIINDPSLKTGPFSHKLHWVMDMTMKHLCDNIQNARLGYTQSDEITILLTDWQNLNTDQWFDGNIQKIVSVSASMAAKYFNYFFRIAFEGTNIFENKTSIQELSLLADFDSRVFNLPKEEVTNCFIWRQQDASRNSVQMLGHYFFSQKEMHGKSNQQVQDMLMSERHINWNDIDTWKKRGSCYHPKWIVTKETYSLYGTHLDQDIPIFTQDRSYIEQYL